MFRDMLSLLPSNYKNKPTNNMEPDKLFNVIIVLGYERKLGIVKAEDIPEAMGYLKENYPNWVIESIDESIRTIL